MENKEQSDYIKRLCLVAREKSLLGESKDAAAYFLKALEIASQAPDFLTICSEVYFSDLEGNKFFAYATFLKCIEAAENPIKYFRRLNLRKDLVLMLAEFKVKMPDHLFHFLLDHAQNNEEERVLAEIFQSFEPFISEPAPVMILSRLRKAS